MALIADHTLEDPIMTLRYSIFYYLMCGGLNEDTSVCVAETESMLNAETLIEQSKEIGWVTEDGLHWFCPEHVSDAVVQPYVPKHQAPDEEDMSGKIGES